MTSTTARWSIYGLSNMLPCRLRLPVFLAMSGGVDSSVTALLLTKLSDQYTASCLRPLTLLPIYMRNWSTLEESDRFEPGSGGAAGCEWQREWESVQDVCRALQLEKEPQLVDLSREYWASVFEPSLDVWQRGDTPNPDVLCNREIKFGALVRRLIGSEQGREGGEELEVGASRASPQTWIATGHYARVAHDASTGETQLHRARHRGKDQSYFLSSVPSTALSRALFPLAGLTKPEVRDLARRYGLPTAAKKESMGLCFVGKRATRVPAVVDDGGPSSLVGPPSAAVHPSLTSAAPTFGGWLSGYLPPSTPYTRPGPILAAADGASSLTPIGTHEGLHTLTIGQRAKLPGLKQRWFIAAKRVRMLTERSESEEAVGVGVGVGEAIVVPGHDHPLLQCVHVEVPSSSFQWVSASGPPSELAEAGAGPDLGVPLLAQLRHRSPEVPCRVSLRRSRMSTSGPLLRITFDVDADGRRPTAVCPGQTLALYDGQRCLGSVVVPGPGDGNGEAVAVGAGGVKTVAELQQSVGDAEEQTVAKTLLQGQSPV